MRRFGLREGTRASRAYLSTSVRFVLLFEERRIADAWKLQRFIRQTFSTSPSSTCLV